MADDFGSSQSDNFLDNELADTTASGGEIQPEPLVVSEKSNSGIINTFSKLPTEDHSRDIKDPKNIIRKSMGIKFSQYLKDITNS